MPVAELNPTALNFRLAANIGLSAYCFFGEAGAGFGPAFRQNGAWLMGVVFSGKDGVFANITPLQINALQLSAQIIRHRTPDYQTHLVSS